MRCESFYFVTAGTLNYQFMFQYCETTPVTAEEWICEAVLWTNWQHNGQLTVNSAHCQIMELRAQDFLEFAEESTQWMHMQRYARLFVSFALRENRVATEISDLWGSCDFVKDLTTRVFRKDARGGNRTSQINTVIRVLETDSMKLQTSFESWRDLTAKRKQRQLSLSSITRGFLTRMTTGWAG